MTFKQAFTETIEKICKDPAWDKADKNDLWLLGHYMRLLNESFSRRTFQTFIEWADNFCPYSEDGALGKKLENAEHLMNRYDAICEKSLRLKID